MKILFLGDVSNFHNTLAHALRSAGHECVVASMANSWQRIAGDIDISREDGILGTAKFAAKLPFLLAKMCGYDIVHFINPHFLSLKPNKLAQVLAFLKQHNRYLFYSACCTDYDYLSTCHDGSTFRYSDFLLGYKPSPYVESHEWTQHNHWDNPEVVNYHHHFINNMDGIVACLYEYFVSYKNQSIPLAYAGIPIDTDAFKPRYIESEPQKVRFFIGIQRQKTILKGADRLLYAAQRITERYPQLCELAIAESVPFKEYVNLMSSSHVILDQLYSYTPATNALMAMAQGMIAVSGAEPEFYDFIGETTNRPIINVSPLTEDDIYNKLEWIILNKSQLPAISRASREFVVKHNDSRIVAQKHIDFWNKIITK